MSLLGPLIMVALVMSRLWMDMIPRDPQNIRVVDETGVFFGKLETNESCIFSLSTSTLAAEKQSFYSGEDDLILYIPSNILSGQTAQVFFKKQPGMDVTSYIRTQVGKRLQEVKLIASGIDREALKKTQTSIKLLSTKVSDNGVEESGNTGVKLLAGTLGGLLIYFFVFLFGSQVMRGVIEEKSSRIIEVIVSSVKPVELMLGKIIGVAAVGFTQFVLWVMLTYTLTTFSVGYFMKQHYSSDKVEQVIKQNAPVTNGMEEDWEDSATLSALGTIRFDVILPLFAFYFLGGYLLYGALFAAIGAAVDNEADTQQFILPVSAPLILSIAAAQVVVTNPESAVAHVLSLFPLTSPVIMMVRIPFGVPVWEVMLSMGLLVAGFLLTTWLAAKIYRTGILMYGKKTTFREMLRWMVYKG